MFSKELIDISVPLSNNLPTWPGGYGLSISALEEIKNNVEVNVSRLDMDVHCGTHIDSSLHVFRNGKTTDCLSLNRMIGDCFVAELPKDIKTISASDLAKLKIPSNTSRLLLKTSNSLNNLWDRKDFYEDYCAISNDAAMWIVQNEIDLIGIDYCSIQKFNDELTTHRTLLENDVIILEGLDLRKVNSGCYELICLPISVIGIEGVPVRAVLNEIRF